MKIQHILRPLLCVFLCLLIGGGSGFLTMDSINTWYTTLNKPFFTPPNWIFGPVWTILYTIRGISAGLVWNNSFNKKTKNKALGVFTAHMLLNGLWSVLFFGFMNPELAFIEILLLLGTILYYSKLFHAIYPLTAWMQVPYITWVTFATLLNGSIAWLN